MTNKLAAFLLPFVIACTAEAPPKEPTKVYDFSASELAALVHIQAPKTGTKASLRGSVMSVQRELLGCYLAHGHGARGTIALSLRLSGGPDGTIVESVDVGGDVTGDAFVDCIRDTAMMIEFAPLPGSLAIPSPLAHEHRARLRDRKVRERSRAARREGLSDATLGRALARAGRAVHRRAGRRARDAPSRHAIRAC